MVIRMDKIIKPILQELNNKLVTSKPENRRITEIPISKQEIRALQLIHSGKFTKIEIRLGDGDIGFIKAYNYTTIKKGEKSATEIGKIVTGMSKHHTVNVYGDDGSVIKLQHTQTFKV